MMIKLICLLETAKFNVKHMAFMPSPNFNGIDKKGGRTQPNARGSTRKITSLIDKDLLSYAK